MNLNDTINDFLQFANALIAANIDDANEVLTAFAAWCQRVTPDGVTDPYDDAVMTQWGSMNFLNVDPPQDTRSWSDSQLTYRDVPERYIDITRQICPPSGDFDSDAAGLTVQLSFGAEGDAPHPAGNSYVPGSATFANELDQIRNDPNAAALLGTPVVRIQAMVGYIG